jgi:hypothetical protein
MSRGGRRTLAREQAYLVVGQASGQTATLQIGPAAVLPEFQLKVLPPHMSTQFRLIALFMADFCRPMAEIRRPSPFIRLISFRNQPKKWNFIFLKYCFILVLKLQERTW